jgi:glycosyltransferase involved in cell wall biosynthesis
MKVCILTHTFPRFYGDTAAPFMGELSEALAKLKHKVFVVLPYDNQINPSLKRNYKLMTYKYIFPKALHLLGYSRTLEDDQKMKFANILLSPFMILFACIKLIRLVKKENIDIISAHWVIPNGFVAALASQVTGVPFTVTIPGSDVYLGAKNALFRWMTGYAVKRAQKVISDSQFYLQQLNKLGFYPTDTQIIRYGVNSEKFTIEPKNRQLLDKFNINDEKILLTVGRMVAKKGFGYLIEAMPDILAVYPKTKLLLVGDGDLKDQLIKKVKKYKIIKSVIFTGEVSYNELYKYYSLADIYIMPSIKDRKGNIDSSPVALMIAAMSGCPLVATKYALGGQTIPEKIGYVVKEKNSKEIVDKTISLLKKDINLKTKEAVRKYAINNYSVSQAARKYSLIFKKIREI